MAGPLEEGSAEAAELPELLSETGLWVPGTRDPRPELLVFAPQYPLWSDGAEKRRWLELPPNTFIDARDADDWVFPVGTRAWKEFSVDGRRVETRYLEALPDGSWRFATYVWEGDDARRAPEAGARLEDGYVVPSAIDCVACHEGRRSPILGFAALQLSGDRDPLAPHASSDPDAVVLAELVGRGLVRGLSSTVPRIAGDPIERAALGYLHGNCGGCHHDRGPLASLGLVLWRSVEADDRASLFAPARFCDDAWDADHRVVAGAPERSVLALRMGSRVPHQQMPPIGTRRVDETARALVEQWIRNERTEP